MRIPLNACCIGGPDVEMSPVSTRAMLVVVSIYSLIGAVAFAATTILF